MPAKTLSICLSSVRASVSSPGWGWHGDGAPRGTRGTRVDARARLRPALDRLREQSHPEWRPGPALKAAADQYALFTPYAPDLTRAVTAFDEWISGPLPPDAGWLVGVAGPGPRRRSRDVSARSAIGRYLRASSAISSADEALEAPAVLSRHSVPVGIHQSDSAWVMRTGGRPPPCEQAQ